MTSLEIHRLDRSSGIWSRIATAEQGEPFGAMYDHKADGTKDIIRYHCALNSSKSIVARRPVDTDEGRQYPNGDIFSEKWVILRELHPGESFEMDIRTDPKLDPQTHRFTHK